ncbi:hypothetical protein AgCh_011850 [Apium graveolens]
MGSLWRERDTSEAERAQHVKQIYDFQDHMQEKERQFMELQEQHRASQETLSFLLLIVTRRVKPLNYHMVKEDIRLQRKESRNRAVTILTLPIISFSQTPDN